jgi:hypothetical protein
MGKRLVMLLQGVCLLVGGGSAALAAAPVSSVVPEPRVYIIAPADGESITGPVTVRFGLAGMGVAPAGIERAGTGHHHLLLNVAELPALDKPLPSDAQHLHFGAGQTEVLLDLPPGEHTLRLVFADHNHVPHDPPLISVPVSIRVLAP